MELKYKKRKLTESIRVLYEPKNKTVKEIYKEQRCSGLFNIGYQFILLPDGTLEEGIPFYVYADFRFAHVNDSVYVLAVGCKDKDSMTKAQMHTLDNLGLVKRVPIIYSED